MDQGVRYVVRLDDINVSTGLRNMEGQAMRTERSVASLNETLRNVAGAFGAGIGLHAVFSFGKDAMQGAADYETAVKRIKFASDNLIQGAKNVSFISGEVDKFAIPLQHATDSYGKFLAMLSGSGIGSDQVRKLHDELLLIGKIKGLDDGQLNAAVMNLGKMLESGSLDARHFRPLEQQLSGIGAFVAKELGISVHQLAILRNKGKMTTIDPRVLLRAIEAQARSLEQFLPESMTTIQSQLNELDNAWLRFKNDLVISNKEDLIDLFDTLKAGIGWLHEHKDTIIHVAKNLAELAKYWVIYKGVVLTANGALSVYNAFMEGFVAKEAAAVTATEARTVAITQQTLAVNALTAALERQMAIQAGGSGLVGYGGMAAAGGITAGSATAGAAAVNGMGVAELLGTMLFSEGALVVGIAAASIGAIAVVLQEANRTDAIGATDFNNRMLNIMERRGAPDYEFYPGTGYPDHMKNDFFSTRQSVYDVRTGEDMLADDKKGQPMVTIIGAEAGYDYLKQLGLKEKKWTGPYFRDGSGEAGNTAAGIGGSEHYAPPDDKITGSRVVSYHISIKEINGIKENTVQNGGQMDTKKVGEALRDIIINIVNDSQLQGDR